VPLGTGYNVVLADFAIAQRLGIGDHHLDTIKMGVGCGLHLPERDEDAPALPG
jgi:hypothetical protein